jgi:hypothetical protein
MNWIRLRDWCKNISNWFIIEFDSKVRIGIGNESKHANKVLCFV